MSGEADLSFKLFGKTYEVACAPKQRAAFDKAVKVLQQHAESIHQSNPEAAIDRVAVVTALNICHAALTDNVDSPNGLDARLDEMSKRIAAAQEKSKQAGFS